MFKLNKEHVNVLKIPKYQEMGYCCSNLNDNSMNNLYNLYLARETWGSSSEVYSLAVALVLIAWYWQSGKNMGNYFTSRAITTWSHSSPGNHCDLCCFSQHGLHGIHSLLSSFSRMGWVNLESKHVTKINFCSRWDFNSQPLINRPAS